MSGAHPIRILIAEEHLIARVGVTTIVNMQPDMTVVAEAANGLQAVEMFRKHLPDVTLLDLRMPGMTGLEAAAAIRREYPKARLIALTTYGGDEDIRRALQAGVQAYLTKDVLHDDLLKAIRAVHAGHPFLPPSVAKTGGRLPAPDLSARNRSAFSDREWPPQQADRPSTQHRRTHREKPRQKHPQQAERGRPDPGRHGRHPAWDYSSAIRLA
jgi:DNA-binding NarL/FixJ family response regulator